MKRTLVGTYGRHDGSGLARIHRAAEAAGERLHEIDRDPLTLAITGESTPSNAGSALCAIDGRISDPAVLAEALGLPPDSSSELIAAAAYARWGKRMLQRLRGEFVIFLWDRRSERGLIARDQLGARSLYFHPSGEQLTFGSEVKDVLAALRSDPGPAGEALAHYLVGNPLPAGTTLYEGVHQLRPGHYLALAEGGWREACYWSPTYRPPHKAPREELAARLAGQIERAVDRRVSSSDRAAVIMSGGLDSASIAAVAGRRGTQQLTAYSGVFPGRPTMDESQWIEALSSELGLPTVRIAPESRGLMADALGHIETWCLPPSGFGFWIPQLYQRAATDGADLVLTGDGGDELCEARPYQIADQVRSGRLDSALRTARQLPGMGDHPPLRAVLSAFRKYGLSGSLPHSADLAASRLPWSNGPEKPWLTSASNDLLRKRWDPTEWKKLDGPRWWGDVCDRLLRRVQGLGLLDHVRREAERAGMEPAFPFFDVDLVEFSLRVPPEALLSPYLRKPLLRTAMTGRLPESVRLRLSKTVFDELTIDVVTGPELSLIADLVSAPSSQIGAYVERGPVSELVGNLTAGGNHETRDRVRHLWRLAAVECWLRSLEDPGLVSRMTESGIAPPGGHRWIRGTAAS